MTDDLQLRCGPARSSGPGRTPLRTVFCTSGGVYGALVLRRLIESPDLEVCAVVRSSRVLNPRYGFIRGAVEQIRRSGLRYAAYLFVCTTLADVLQRRDAGARRVPVLVTRDLNDAAGLAFLRDCAPDLLVSAYFNQRLGEAVLGSARRAAINLHPSLLPDLKGVDPAFQARLRGLPMGVTVHHMTPDLDAGHILVHRPVEVPPAASVFAATALLFDAGAQALVSALPRLRAGDAGVAQPGTGSYQSWPTRAEVRALHDRGATLMHPADFAALRGAPRRRR